LWKVKEHIAVRGTNTAEQMAADTQYDACPFNNCFQDTNKQAGHDCDCDCWKLQEIYQYVRFLCWFFNDLWIRGFRNRHTIDAVLSEKSIEPLKD